MTPRIELKRHAGSGAARALMALQAEVDRGPVEPSIIDLIKVRSSQVNGCAYASICTRKTGGSTARASGVCTR
jgi:hypothetical protein